MPYLAAGRIERDNVRADLAQEMLAFLVMYSFVKVGARFAGKGVLFWPVLEEIDNMFREREPIIADDLPADVIRAIVDDLLIDTREVPVVGDKVFLTDGNSKKMGKTTGIQVRGFMFEMVKWRYQ